MKNKKLFKVKKEKTTDDWLVDQFHFAQST